MRLLLAPFFAILTFSCSSLPLSAIVILLLLASPYLQVHYFIFIYFLEDVYQPIENTMISGSLRLTIKQSIRLISLTIWV